MTLVDFWKNQRIFNRFFFIFEILTANDGHFHGSVLVGMVVSALEQYRPNGKWSHLHRDNKHIGCQYQIATCIYLKKITLKVKQSHMLIPSLGMWFEKYNLKLFTTSECKQPNTFRL